MATYNGHNEDSSGNILLSIGNGMTATVETGTTASQAYTKGAYLFFNNRLCKATTAISSGATLAVGTNLSQTSLGAELTSHLRSSDGKEFYFDVKDGTYGYYPSASKVSSEFVPFGGTIKYVQASATINAGYALGVYIDYDSVKGRKVYVSNQTNAFNFNYQIDGNIVYLNSATSPSTAITIPTTYSSDVINFGCNANGTGACAVRYNFLD